MALRPCRSCRRHIQAAAPACPFCQPTLAAAIAVGLAIAACGGNPAPAPVPSPPAADARPERGDIYGVPRQLDARPAPPPDAAPVPDAARPDAAPRHAPKPPPGTMQPMYGVPLDRGD